MFKCIINKYITTTVVIYNSCCRFVLSTTKLQNITTITLRVSVSDHYLLNIYLTLQHTTMNDARKVDAHGQASITLELRSEIKALFKLVSVSKICADLGIRRWRVYAALNNEAATTAALEDLAAVVNVARIEAAKRETLIQSL